MGKTPAPKKSLPPAKPRRPTPRPDPPPPAEPDPPRPEADDATHDDDADLAPLEQLLLVAVDVRTFANKLYGGPRQLTAEQQVGAFVGRRELLNCLARASAAVVATDFGPRVSLADVEARVGGLRVACERTLMWAFRRHGMVPPALSEKDCEGLTMPAPWPEDVAQGWAECLAMSQELAEAAERVRRLRDLAKTGQDGPEPPDKFRWHGQVAEELSACQYRLLFAQWEAGPPSTELSVEALVRKLYNSPLDSAHRKALERLRTRTQQTLDRYKVRIWIGLRNNRVWLEPVEGD